MADSIERCVRDMREAARVEGPTGMRDCLLSVAGRLDTMATGPVHQFRVEHCADWYDGRPDRSDGKRYETRVLYAAPTVAAAMAATVPAEQCQICGEGTATLQVTRYCDVCESSYAGPVETKLARSLTQAPVAGQPAEPSPADPKNPHWDYLARYWQMGYEGTSLEACTGDAPIKAWHEGKTARAAGKRKLRPGEPTPPPGPQAAWCDLCGGCYEWGGNGLWHHAGCKKIPEGHGTAWLESAPKGDSNG